MATFVAAFADWLKKMDALKVDAELADIPVIMISIDDRLAAAPKNGRICKQTPGAASSGERCGAV